MPPQSSSAISDSTTNGTKVNHRKEKTNGQAPSVPKATRRGFFGRFGAITGFTFLAGLWAAIRHSSWAPRPSYALCSRDGDFIYTVDENNANVQCVVVKGAHISYTGSLCTSFFWKLPHGLNQPWPRTIL
jgi:hypothetical protein